MANSLISQIAPVFCSVQHIFPLGKLHFSYQIETAAIFYALSVMSGCSCIMHAWHKVSQLPSGVKFLLTNCKVKMFITVLQEPQKYWGSSWENIAEVDSFGKLWYFVEIRLFAQKLWWEGEMGKESDRLCTTRADKPCLNARVGLIWRILLANKIRARPEGL